MSSHHQSRILLADNDPRVCWSLRLLLRHKPGLAMVNEDQEETSLLDRAATSRPHIILLDWELAAETPSQLFSDLHDLEPRPAVIVLSVQPEWERYALDAGADAFVAKIDPPEKLLQAVERFVSTRT